MAIKTHFEQDNFDSRRTTGHNMFDPESLITGYELAHGFTYANSHRDYPGQHTYDAIVAGDVPAHIVPLVAPRVFNRVASLDAELTPMVQLAKSWNIPATTDEIKDVERLMNEARAVARVRLVHLFDGREERTI